MAGNNTPENNNLEARLAETEKATAGLAGQVEQIGKTLVDLGRILDRNRDATEEGFRELRKEIRHEVNEVRPAKGQWVAILSVGIALVGLIGGPFLVYTTTTNETLARFEERQHHLALASAREQGAQEERRFWLDRTLRVLGDDVDELEARLVAGEPERWRRSDALAERDMLQNRLDELRNLILGHTTGGLDK
jgi:hypothetical protein